jgi:hypothetical protein
VKLFGTAYQMYRDPRVCDCFAAGRSLRSSAAATGSPEIFTRNYTALTALYATPA